MGLSPPGCAWLLGGQRATESPGKVALAKTPEQGRAQGCPSFPVTGSCTRQEQSPGWDLLLAKPAESWLLAGNGFQAPTEVLDPSVDSPEEQQGSPLCFVALKIPNPAAFLPGKGVSLLRTAGPRTPMGPPAL